MYIITARRITSGELLKQRKGFCIRRGYGPPLPASSRFSLTRPANELFEIFVKICENEKNKLAPAAEKKLAIQIEKIWNARERGFGNGRAMRNLFEECLARQAERIAGKTALSTKDLIYFNSEDIPEIPANS